MNKHSKTFLEIEVGSSFVLLLSLIFFFSDWKLPLSIIICVLIHETGHLTAMEILGIHPLRIKADISGFTIESKGQEDFFKNIIIALAGPLFGIMQCILFSLLNTLSGIEFLSFCAKVSLLINLYNLLPIIPLDGGRVMKELFIKILGTKPGNKLSFYTSLLLASALECTGIYLMLKKDGPALALGALWPLLWQLNSACKKRRFGIK